MICELSLILQSHSGIVRGSKAGTLAITSRRCRLICVLQELYESIRGRQLGAPADLRDQKSEREYRAEMDRREGPSGGTFFQQSGALARKNVVFQVTQPQTTETWCLQLLPTQDVCLPNEQQGDSRSEILNLTASGP